MAFSFVQMLLALLFTHVCMCTRQDLDTSNIAVGVVRQIDTLKEKSKALVDLAVGGLAGGRNKRSLSPSDRTDSVTTMNNLRRTTGASNMPYMIYSNVQENNAALWTEDCNFDQPVTSTTNAYHLKYVTSHSLSVPSILIEGFKSYSLQLSSVYLKSFGCDLRKCSTVIYKGTTYVNADLTLCLFEAENQFDDTKVQYKLGEGCTECDSGSLWCDHGLCRVNKPTSLSLATDVKNLDLVQLRMVHSQPEVARSNPKGNERMRRKRSFTITYAINITDTVNSLRSYVGASDMNYLTYSNSVEDDAANWTSDCNYDATFYTNVPGALVYVIKANSPYPINHVSTLNAAFNNSNFYNGLRSVELRSVGAAYSQCSNAVVNGVNVTNAYLAVYVFSYTSNFNASVRQYTVGEACTTCRSGSYWCYQGLCKDDCSASDSNCYCNSYCQNCANTNTATCMCQCLQGWNGSRCDTKDSINATTPTCSTTARVPFTWTTQSTTTVAPTTTARSTKNVAPIRKPMIQLSLYATMALFLRLYIDQGLCI